jgi:hypothetical protein
MLFSQTLGEAGFAPGARDLDRLPVCVSLVVWGERYTDFFLEFCLPSLLADGNFPAMRHRAGSFFIIHTSAADAPRIRASDAFAAVSALVDVDLRIVDISAMPPHEMLSRCHRDAISTADSLGRPIVFLSPDTVWSKNTFEAVDVALSSGKRVLFMPNVRAVKEDSLELLGKLLRQGRINVSSRELMSIALSHLHPTTEEHIVIPGRGERLLPAALLWPNARGDLLGRFFHAHPLMVFPKTQFAAFRQTIDGDFVQFACPDTKEHQIILDSDQATAIEFSARSQFIGGVTGKDDAQGVMRWAQHCATAVHWGLFSHPVRLHAAPIQESEWKDVEHQADQFVSKVFRLRRWWGVDALREDAGWVIANYMALPGRALLALAVSVACMTAIVRSIAFRAALGPEGVGLTTREKIFRARHGTSFAVRETVFRNHHAIAFAIRQEMLRNHRAITFAAREKLLRSSHAMREKLFRAHVALEEKRFRVHHAIVHSIRSIWIRRVVSYKLKRIVLWSIAKGFGSSIDDAALRLRRLRGLDPA